MHTYTPNANKILTSLEIKNHLLIGEGSEAQVFDFPPDKIVKILKHPTTIAELKSLQDLYVSLSCFNLSFTFPQIEKILYFEDTPYLIERKIEGQTIASLYKSLKESERFIVLKNYFEAVDSLKTIRFDTLSYGKALKNSLKTYENWHQFIKETAASKVEATRTTLFEEGLDIQKILEKFSQAIKILPLFPEKCFIHGDYFFGNVLVNRKLEISALLDAGSWSFIGDHCMDIACSIMYLDLYEYVTNEERAFLQNLAVERYGEVFLEFMQVYKIFYALLFADCKTFDPTTFSWSINALKNMP